MTTKSLKRKAPAPAQPKDTDIASPDFEALVSEWLRVRSGEFD